MSLSDKKLWLRDYDLENVRDQVISGDKDDCIVMWKEVEKSIQELKDRIYKHTFNGTNNINTADVEFVIDEVFGEEETPKTEGAKK